MADDELYKPMTRLEHILADDGEVEPATRFEKIMAGQSVDDMTRGEYFWKKKIDSGGGGGSTPTPTPTGGYTVYELCQGAPESIIDTSDSVKIVKSCAFQSTSEIKYVDLPAVQEIMNSTFKTCSNLSCISVPNVKKIGIDAFASCSSLTGLSLSQCLTIGISAFTSCVSLTEINLPACTVIDSSAFYNCYNVSKISIPNCTSLRSCALFGITYDELIVPKLKRIYNYCCGNPEFISADACRTVDAYGLLGATSLKSIYMPLLQNLGEEAFYNCVSLEELPDLDSAGGVPSHAFAYCVKIKSARFFNTTYFNQGAFWDCKALESLYVRCTSVPTMQYSNVLGNTPMQYSSYIGKFGSIFVPASVVDAYKSATNWVYYSDRIVALPESESLQFIYPYEFMSSTITEVPSERKNAERIGQYAFKSCYSLASIDFPECVTVLRGAFERCSSLSIAYLSKAIGLDAYAFYYCSNLQEIHADSVITIDGECFAYCSKLRVVDLPNCVQIESNTNAMPFRSCYSIETFNAPKLVFMPYALLISTQISEAIFPECQTIMNNAFSSCSKLVTASFDNCTTLNGDAFLNCSNLKTAYFPKLVNMSYQNNFASCSSLEGIDLPEVRMIGYETFAHCVKLKTINAPMVSFIGESAFRECSLLEIANFPLLESINKFAFLDCSSLKEFHASILKSAPSHFLYYSLSSLSVVDIPNLEFMSTDFLTGANLVTELSFPKLLMMSGSLSTDGTTIIQGSYIKSVYMPLLLHCGDGGLTACSRLTDVTMPKVQFVGAGAFASCISLKEIDLPECLSLSYISSYSTRYRAYAHTFSGCALLETAKLPKIEDLGASQAFKNCPALTSLYLNSSKFVSYPANGESIRSECTIYVPASLITQYQTTEGWSSHVFAPMD